MINKVGTFSKQFHLVQLEKLSTEAKENKNEIVKINIKNKEKSDIKGIGKTNKRKKYSKKMPKLIDILSFEP